MTLTRSHVHHPLPLDPLLPGHIYRTFAGDLVRDVDAVGRHRVLGLRCHTSSLRLYQRASKESVSRREAPRSCSSTEHLDVVSDGSDTPAQRPPVRPKPSDLPSPRLPGGRPPPQEDGLGLVPHYGSAVVSAQTPIAE
jgi:hypothetical protein